MKMRIDINLILEIIDFTAHVDNYRLVSNQMLLEFCRLSINSVGTTVN